MDPLGRVLAGVVRKADGGQAVGVGQGNAADQAGGAPEQVREGLDLLRVQEGAFPAGPVFQDQAVQIEAGQGAQGEHHGAAMQQCECSLTVEGRCGVEPAGAEGVGHAALA